MPDAGRPPTPTVRGVVMLGLLDWVRSTHGDPGFAKLLARLPDDIRQRYDPRPKLVGTMPVPGPELAALANAIIEVWGVPAYHAAAAHVAISDLNSYMKLFLKVGTPSFVLRRLPRVLNHYCSDGELTIDVTESGAATLSIRNVEAYGRGIREGAVGWIRAALELSGARDLAIEAQHADGVSSYRVRWT